MSSKNLSRALVIAFVAVSVGSLLSLADVSAGWGGKKILDQTGCCKRCPACDHVCNLDAEQVEEEKTCFDVETKVICIPRVVFPWQKKKSCDSCDACDGRGCSVCVHNGARVRKVCVLKTDKYKCPKCEYTWSAEKKPCTVGCCDTAGCDTGCATAPCDAGVIGMGQANYSEVQSVGLEPVAVEGHGEALPAPAPAKQ